MLLGFPYQIQRKQTFARESTEMLEANGLKKFEKSSTQLEQHNRLPQIPYK